MVSQLESEHYLLQRTETDCKTKGKYLGTMKLFRRANARRHHRDLISNLPQSLDQVQKSDLHS